MPAASRFVLAVSLVCGLATRASSQDVGATHGPVRPAPVVEVSGGWAGFIDERISDPSITPLAVSAPASICHAASAWDRSFSTSSAQVRIAT